MTQTKDNSPKTAYKHFKALVLMQLRDKTDTSFIKSVKKAITKVVFLLLRILVVAAVSYLLFYYSAFLSLFSIGGVVPLKVVNIVFTIIFVLSVFSCTKGLMNTLYFADDNRVLVTMPVNGNMVFFSKLVVYYVFELARSYTFTLPLFIGYGVASGLPWYMYVWMIFVLLFISAAPVAIGALLSLPTMAIYQFLKRHEPVKVTLFVLLVGVCVAAIVELIMLIPENINLIQQWPWISKGINSFVDSFSVYSYPLLLLTTMVFGEYYSMAFHFTGSTMLVFVCLVAMLVLVLAIVYFIAKPLFLKMTAQPFEYEKKEFIKAKENRKRKKYKSILRKEFFLNLRSTEISYSFLAVYIAVPVLILLLNRIFAAMNTKLLGQYMTYSFNLLIMLLILLASNAVISTMYSMEGRAGGMKKTKPLDLTMPLLCKTFYNAIFSFVSIVVAITIFGSHTTLSLGCIIMLAVSVLGFQYGHMLLSAELDLMNPQNEQYATTGGQIDNPNSNKSTVTAFIVSFAVFAFSLVLFTENVTTACVKLMLLGLAFMTIRAYLFVIKIRLYYKEKM